MSDGGGIVWGYFLVVAALGVLGAVYAVIFAGVILVECLGGKRAPR